MGLDQHVLTHLSNASRFIKSNDYPDFINKWLTQYHQNRHSLLFVAESEGFISGFILAHVQTQEWYRETRVGLIGACFVHSLYRRRGLASQMVAEVKNWFRNEQVTYIDVVWDEGNVDAEKFWQALGFKSSQIRAHCKLI